MAHTSISEPKTAQDGKPSTRRKLIWVVIAVLWAPMVFDWGWQFAFPDSWNLRNCPAISYLSDGVEVTECKPRGESYNFTAIGTQEDYDAFLARHNAAEPEYALVARSNPTPFSMSRGQDAAYRTKLFLHGGELGYDRWKRPPDDNDEKDVVERPRNSHRQPHGG